MASPSASSVPTYLAIAAGNTVTTWDCNQEEPTRFSFQPHGDIDVGDIAWNHNGQVIASCSAVSTDEHPHNSIALTASQSGTCLDALQHNQQWTRTAGATNSVTFGGKSRYLCIGDESGAACLWDLKKRIRVRQFFHDGYPCLQASLDPNDTFVLSLSQRMLSIYNLREGTHAMTLSPNGDFMYTKYHMSSLEPHLAAIGTDDGGVLLYDITNHQQSLPLSTLRRYQSSITGLAFSPTNEKLVASTSTDGTLLFYDRHTRESVQQLASVNSSITSLSLHSNGISCAIGTETGQVHVYDLRQTKPVASMLAQGAVTCLQFAPPPKKKDHGSTPNKSPKINSGPKGAYTGPYISNVSSSQLSSGLQTETAYYEPKQVYSGPPADVEQSPPPPQAKAAPPPKVRSALQNRRISAAKSPAKSPISAREVEPTAAAAAAAGATTTTPASTRRDVSPPKKVKSPPTEIGMENGSRQYTRSSNRESNALSSPNRTMNDENNKLQMDQVKEMVREEIENMRDDLEEAIRNLHMDMISQFHQQSQELNNTLSMQLQTIERLTEENQRLREDNVRIRNGFPPE